jgi:hypothetical protein
MPAIITDQFRISNANKFISEVSNGTNSYYAFVGLTNPEEYKLDWDESPRNPRDNFDNENDYWDTIIGLSKILPDNARQVVRKTLWESGSTYDMYRHDISIDNLSSSSKTSLYASNYYVVNKNLRVYICLDNGAAPENNFRGNPSLDEPDFIDLEPKSAGTSGDGYVWKYLYTINPNDLIKFDSIFYITTPRNWATNPETQSIVNHARNSGQLKIVKIKNRGISVLPQGTYTGIPIKGDGFGAEVTIVVNSQQKVDSVTISNGGSGYTYGTVDLTGIINTNTIIEYPIFDVIIPPKGGHGYDIYRELGASSVLLYTRIETNSQNPDFITGNKIARIGIVQNPTQYTGLGPENSETLLNDTTVSALYALKLSGNISSASFPANSFIAQNVETNKIAVGRVISYDRNTGVLKYWQDRRLVGFNTDGSKSQNPPYGFELYKFTGTPSSGGSLIININGVDSGMVIDSSFGSSENPSTTYTSINNITYQLGQSFIRGISNPEVERYSGSIIHVDNRPSITRSQSQKEDIKVILQF